MRMEPPVAVVDDGVAALLLAKKEIERMQAENDQLHVQADRYKTQADTLTDDNERFKKHIVSLQQDLEDAGAERDRLEQRVYAREQESDALQQEVQQLLRRQRDIEKQTRKEAAMTDSERAAWQEKETALQEQLTTVQRQLHRALDTQQQLTPSSTPSLLLGEPTSEEAADLRARQRELMIAQKNIREQDKLILELRGKIEKEGRATENAVELYHTQHLRVAILEREVGQLKDLNKSLQEDNESYQMLLQEKTMKGDFSLGGLGTDEALLAPPSPANGLGIDLATELTRALSPPGSPRLGASSGIHELEQINQISHLKGDLKALKDENKAMTLYINKILARIMEHKQLENILARDYEQPLELVVKSPPPHRRSSLQVTPSMLSPQRRFEKDDTDCDSKADMPLPPKTAGLVSGMPSDSLASPIVPTASEGRSSGGAAGYLKRWRRHQSMSLPRGRSVESALSSKEPTLTETVTVTEAEEDANGNAAAAAAAGDLTANAPNGGLRRAWRRMSTLGGWKFPARDPTAGTADTTLAASHDASSGDDGATASLHATESSSSLTLPSAVNGSHSLTSSILEEEEEEEEEATTTLPPKVTDNSSKTPVVVSGA